MAQELTRPKAGVLALTLELYETLAPGLRGEREAWLRRKVLPALAKEADVVFEGAVFRREDVDRAVAGLEAQGVDAIVVILLTYSPSQIALPALKAARAPVFVWNTQELYAVDRGFDGPKMTANHGVHGTQDLCNTLLRWAWRSSTRRRIWTTRTRWRRWATFCARRPRRGGCVRRGSD